MSVEYPCIYFEEDGKCRKFSDDTVLSYCVMGPCPEQKLSNGDRVRAKSDEELAAWMATIQKISITRFLKMIGYTEDLDSTIVEPEYLKWLQQPAEEEIVT